VKTDKNLAAIAVSIALILGILFFDAIYGTYGELKISDEKGDVFQNFAVGDTVEITYKITNNRFSKARVAQPYIVIYNRPRIVTAVSPGGPVVQREDKEVVVYESPKTDELAVIGAWSSREWKWSYAVNSTGSHRVEVGNRQAEELTERKPYKGRPSFFVD